MDPLSQTIALLRPQAVAWQIIEAHDAWALRLPATDLVAFGQLIEGGCLVELGNGTKIECQPGDFLLKAGPPSAWTMSTPGSGSPIDLKAAIADPQCLLSTARSPAITRFMAGAFEFGAANADLLGGLIPPIIHIRGADAVTGRLGALLKLMGDEALANRPGRSLVLDRLLEIILVESIRHRRADLASARPGLLAGLEDSRISMALRVMHDEVQRPWTVAALAREAGMSRSSFAARFMDTVGSPPMEYLLSWRMNLAKAALSSSQKPMSEIAELAGYQSVSAFSTAFSRTIGRPPSAYARTLLANRSYPPTTDLVLEG